jgi:hypothetical protein
MFWQCWDFFLACWVFEFIFSGAIIYYICVLVCTLVLSLAFLFYCPQVKFSGVTQNQSALKDWYLPKDLYINCNANGGCTDTLEPVCGKDKITVII